MDQAHATRIARSLAVTGALLAMALAVWFIFKDSVWHDYYAEGSTEVSTNVGALAGCWAIACVLASVAALSMRDVPRMAALFALAALIVEAIGVASVGGHVIVTVWFDGKLFRVPTAYTLPVLVGAWAVAALPLAASVVLAARRWRHDEASAHALGV